MADSTIAPMPTAPIGAASPIWPTTAVSTAPRIGIVTFDSTMGSAILRTRPLVTSRGAATVSLTGGIWPRHQEMRGGLREGAGAVVLPGLGLHRGIAPACPSYRGARIGIAWQAGAQVIDCKVDGLGQARQITGRQGLDIQRTVFEIFPDKGPAERD